MSGSLRPCAPRHAQRLRADPLGGPLPRKVPSAVGKNFRAVDGDERYLRVALGKPGNRDRRPGVKAHVHGVNARGVFRNSSKRRFHRVSHARDKCRAHESQAQLDHDIGNAGNAAALSRGIAPRKRFRGGTVGIRRTKCACPPTPACAARVHCRERKALQQSGAKVLVRARKPRGGSGFFQGCMAERCRGRLGRSHELDRAPFKGIRRLPRTPRVHACTPLAREGSAIGNRKQRHVPCEKRADIILVRGSLFHD